MIRLALAILLLAGCSAADDPDQEPSAVLSPSTASSQPAAAPTPSLAAEFAATFGPQAGLATGAGDSVATAGPPYAWSLSKVWIAAQTLVDAGGPSGLTERQESLIAAAMSRSDNAAAAELYRDLEQQHGGLDGAAATLTELLRAAGDAETVVSIVGRGDFSTYGQTIYPDAAAARFMTALAGGCLLDADSTAYLLAAMSAVVPDQSFGLGAITSTFKGGWGPDPSGAYLVRQMGLVKGVAVAISVRPQAGSFAAGKADLTRIATWLQGRLPSAAEVTKCP